MDSSLTFARIINPICSCGNYVGRLQPELEMELVKKSVSAGGKVTTDEDISDFLNKKGITRICCRNTVIISPVLRLMSVPDQFQIHTDNNSIIKKRMHRIVIGNPDPKNF